MKADNAVEDAGEVGKVAGGVTFEWLRQVREWLGVASCWVNGNQRERRFGRLRLSVSWSTSQGGRDIMLVS